MRNQKNAKGTRSRTRHVTMNDGRLTMPFSAAAAAMLRGVGANFDNMAQEWRYPPSAATAVRSLMPALELAAAKQIARSDRETVRQDWDEFGCEASSDVIGLTYDDAPSMGYRL